LRNGTKLAVWFIYHLTGRLESASG